MRGLSDIEIYGCPYCAQHHLHDPYDCETTHTDDTRWLIRKLCRVLASAIEEPERIVFGRRAA